MKHRTYLTIVMAMTIMLAAGEARQLIHWNHPDGMVLTVLLYLIFINLAVYLFLNRRIIRMNMYRTMIKSRVSAKIKEAVDALINNL